MDAPSDGIFQVGTLAPGESKTVYLYIQYPIGVTATATYNYTLSAASPLGSYSSSFTTISRTAISANAGGLATLTIINQNQVGGIIEVLVNYTLGNVQSNDECDFQPTVSPLHDPTLFKLISTEITASNVSGPNVGIKDSLYFRTGNGGSSTALTIKYIFRITSANSSLYILPYAGSTSGNTNYKFAISTDLGANGSAVAIASNANTLSISKSFDKPVYRCGESASFLVTVTNSGANAISLSKITDVLPTNFTFSGFNSGSGVNAANSTSFPATNATGILTFFGGVDSVVSGINLQSYSVPAASGGVNGRLLLMYTALAPGTLSSTDCSGSFGVSTTSVKAFVEGVEAASGSASATLPLKWQRVSAENQNGHAIIYWSTSSEENTKDFVVQHSQNAQQWQDLATLAAAGFSSSAKEYSYLHLNPIKGNSYNYYRILQRDLDGKFSYSKIVYILFSDETETYKVYPNPASDNLTIVLIKPQLVKLINQSGATVLQKQLGAGVNNIPVHQLPKGTYVVMIANRSYKVVIN